MARRQAIAGKPRENSSVDRSGRKLVRLELTSETHRRFRVEAAKEGLPMAIMARSLIEKWLTERGAK
jgi:hypothetical protein